MGSQRGPHPGDASDFGEQALVGLREAVHDLSWLLGRGYTETAALKLVGDRLQLTSRQRKGVLRCAAADDVLIPRLAKQLGADHLAGHAVAIDAFNVAILLERAFGGGAVLIGRDGAVRDVGGVHGTYRLTPQTDAVLRAVGRWLAKRRVSEVLWLLDRPVSNSGRLAERIRAVGAAGHWPWTAEVVNNPDADLRAGTAVVASSDAWVLDGADRWCNLAFEVAVTAAGNPWMVDLRY